MAAQAVVEAINVNESPDVGTLQSILAAEIMVVEGESLVEAEREAWRRIGEDHAQTFRWATERVRNYKAARARSREDLF